MMFKTVLKIAFEHKLKKIPNECKCCSQSTRWVDDGKQRETFNIALQYCIHWHCQVSPEVFEQNGIMYFNSRITCELTILSCFLLFFKWEWTWRWLYICCQTEHRGMLGNVLSLFVSNWQTRHMKSLSVDNCHSHCWWPFYQRTQVYHFTLSRHQHSAVCNHLSVCMWPSEQHIYLQRNLRRGNCACQLFNGGILTTGSPLISLSLRPRFPA